MTTDQLRDRALAHLPGGRARFDPITLLILGAVVSAAIGHYVELGLSKCEAKAIRNPGFIARWKLRRAIRAACNDPRVTASMAGTQWTPASLDAAHGDDVQAALLALVAGLSDGEIASTIGGHA